MRRTRLLVAAAAVTALLLPTLTASAAPSPDVCTQIRDEAARRAALLDAASADPSLSSYGRAWSDAEREVNAAALRQCAPAPAPSPSLTPSDPGTPTPSPPGSVPPTGSPSSPSPSAVPSPTPSSSPATRCPPLPAYPTPACTGVPPGSSLTTLAGPVTLSTPGQVISRRWITGDVTIGAPGIVIRDSIIDGQINNWHGGDPYPYTVVDSTVGPASGCRSATAIGSGRFTARNVLVRGMSDGFRISRDLVTIVDSYVKLCANPGDHSDGIQTEGGGGASTLVEHNTIDQRPVTQDATSPIFWQGTAVAGSRIRYNLLAGGGYTIRVYVPAEVTGNRIVDRSWTYGPSNSACSLLTWSDNRTVTIDALGAVTSTGPPVACTG